MRGREAPTSYIVIDQHPKNEARNDVLRLAPAYPHPHASHDTFSRKREKGRPAAAYITMTLVPIFTRV